MEIKLVRSGTADRALLFRLLQYSLYEESASDGSQIDEDGLFSYPWFDAYFTDPDREAWLIRARDSGQLLGFAMVNTYLQKVPSGHSIAEFMILPSCRRKGIGEAAALACFRTHPGFWEVSPSYGSAAALRFWRRVIRGFMDEEPCLTDGIFVFSSNLPLTNDGNRI